jgi:outer membrane immunogenic protein
LWQRRNSNLEINCATINKPKNADHSQRGIAVKKIISLASVAAVLLLASPFANAADLGRPVYKAPPPAVAPAPALLWTGCYIGGNVGYGWAHKDWFDPQFGVDGGSGTADGIVGGGQLGCDYQIDNFVFGLQGMFDGADLTEDHPLSINPALFTDHSKVSWFATLTGRIGYAFTPVTLAYFKGGAIWAQDKFTETCAFANTGVLCPGEASTTRTGWTVGGGLEYRFVRNWSVFVEYNYADLGNRRSTLVYGNGTYDYDIKQNLQNVLVGVNYRF